MATLYRKYRPQNFAEVVGQNHIKVILQHEIETDKIAHAYLFCGPRAVGKTTVARILAKTVNCLKRPDTKSEPCNDCEICADITAGRSLDVIEIDAASHTGVENVRENVIANARVAPSRCRYKVFIIDEVHMLSTSAFNALLKIIEEPPAPVIFILCTTEVHKVPNTIISRCQRFDFKRISVAEIAKKLLYIASEEGIAIDKEILEGIARLSEGHMRDAESLLGQVVAIGGKKITPEEAGLVIPRSDLNEAIALIGLLSKKDPGAAIELINKLMDEGINLKRFITDTIELLRKIMLNKINPALAGKLGLVLGESAEIEVARVSQGLETARTVHIMEKLIAALNEMKSSFIVQLPVEMAIVEICQGGTERPSFVPPPAPPAVHPPFSGAGPAPARTDTSSAPPAASPGTQKPDQAAIIDKWHEVLAKVKKYNHSLSFILRVCQPRDLNGNQLCLAFRYKFHKDRINESSIRVLVEKVLREVYGSPIQIEAVIDENLVPAAAMPAEARNTAPAPEEPAAPADADKAAPKPEEKGNGGQDNMIDNLLKTFGGKVIK